MIMWQSGTEPGSYGTVGKDEVSLFKLLTKFYQMTTIRVSTGVVCYYIVEVPARRKK
jgi:hypothetical protein